MKAILDLSFVTGVACVCYAGQLVHPALPWLVGGVALLAFALFGAVSRQRKAAKQDTK